MYDVMNRPSACSTRHRRWAQSLGATVQRLNSVGLSDPCPTAALLNEPMMRCDPVCRIQLADHSVYEPRIRTRRSIGAGEFANLRAHRLGWMRSLLRPDRPACPASHPSATLQVTLSQNLVSPFGATLSATLQRPVAPSR